MQVLDGNSESLDYIFVNENFLRKNPELDMIHFNTDYMSRLSDHDPLIAMKLTSLLGALGRYEAASTAAFVFFWGYIEI